MKKTQCAMLLFNTCDLENGQGHEIDMAVKSLEMVIEWASFAVLKEESGVAERGQTCEKQFIVISFIHEKN